MVQRKRLIPDYTCLSHPYPIPLRHSQNAKYLYTVYKLQTVVKLIKEQNTQMSSK